jgi:hypothetical protein
MPPGVLVGSRNHEVGLKGTKGGGKCIKGQPVPSSCPCALLRTNTQSISSVQSSLCITYERECLVLTGTST